MADASVADARRYDAADAAKEVADASESSVPIDANDCAPEDLPSTALFADLVKAPSLDGLRFKLRELGWSSACWEEGQHWRLHWYAMSSKVGTSYRIHCPSKGVSFDFGVGFFDYAVDGTPKGRSLEIRTYPPRVADKPHCKPLGTADDVYHDTHSFFEEGEGACVLEPGCFPRACIPATHLAAARAATPTPASCPATPIDPSWVAVACKEGQNDLDRGVIMRASSLFRPCLPVIAGATEPAFEYASGLH